MNAEEHASSAPVGTIGPEQLDAFVARSDALGLASTACKRYWSNFRYRSQVRVSAPDPLSAQYWDEQRRLYEEISGRNLDQQRNELLDFDLAASTEGANPYASTDTAFIANHARAINQALRIANLPPDPHILDMGCGWGLSTEVLAFAGAQVTAVDINPKFVDLVRLRTARYGDRVRVIRSSFDDFTSETHYDAILFYESLHHATRPWAVIERLAPLLLAGGSFVLCGEPIQANHWKHWGIRLDALSVYCIRKHGWYESGWSEPFLRLIFAKIGFSITMVRGVGLDQGGIVIATRAEDASRRGVLTDPPYRPLLRAVNSRIGYWPAVQYVRSLMRDRLR